jgi:transcriptional regulator with XRE-family HTH domain
MRLKDRRKLARLMATEDVSGRELARLVGYTSHTYMQRLLRGEVKRWPPAVAALVAQRLGVDVSTLFLTEVTTNTGHFRQAQKRPARAAA